MKIAILNALETQQQWRNFSARKIPYVYVLSPLTLVDFQSTFIQVTDIDINLRDGRQAVKYSIGSRRSAEAVWQLIENCQWSLTQLVNQLKGLDFSSNVRDNSVLNVHGELTVRQFFAKEKCIISPWLLQQLAPLEKLPKRYALNDVKRLLSSEQISDISWLQTNPMFGSIRALLITLVSHPNGWQVRLTQERIYLHFKKEPIISFTPIAAKPTQSKLLQML